MDRSVFSIWSLMFATACVGGMAFVPAAQAQECDGTATVGSAGSAAVGGTSASTLGTAGACGTPDGSTSSIGSAGSAATTDGRAQSRTKIVENPSQLKAQSRAQAMDKGTFSKSRTKTTVSSGALETSTRTMTHQPGEKPTKNVATAREVMPTK